MKKKQGQTFTVVSAEGKEITCEVLFTFSSQETGKNYLVYTDNTLDDKGSLKIYAAYYDPTAVNSPLTPIENEAEWMAINRILEEAVRAAQTGKSKQKP